MLVSADKNEKEYVRALIKYLQTKEGKAKTLYIMSQVFPAFKIDSKGRITEVSVNDTDPIVLEFE